MAGSRDILVPSSKTSQLRWQICKKRDKNVPTPSYFFRHTHPASWSLTMPVACMKAYIVVDPTKLNPAFRSALLMASDSGEVAFMSSRERTF